MIWLIYKPQRQNKSPRQCSCHCSMFSCFPTCQLQAFMAFMFSCMTVSGFHGFHAFLHASFKLSWFSCFPACQLQVFMVFTFSCLPASGFHGFHGPNVAPSVFTAIAGFRVQWSHWTSDLLFVTKRSPRHLAQKPTSTCS